ncbi:MAG TPA: ribokinase [Candidatus Caldiarchaeum subterraneum]|uniref:Ribokinase n=1 Tax=Caldiarchaeum subterraneum TaxID=311458 RepID=A0A832ZVP8_CALS0|nr:ribokinase [Candidatus Caldarchaeum subterraneum]
MFLNRRNPLATGLRIVVLGATHVDYTLLVDQLPKVGETVTGKTLKLSLGGKGANQAVAATRLGAETYLVSRVGNDSMGRDALEGLIRNGVKTDYVTIDEEATTGVAFIFVGTNGRNMIGVFSGADDKVCEDDFKRVEGILKDTDTLLVQLEIPLTTVRYAVAKAKEMDVTVILNPAPAKPLDSKTLSNIDVITPNEVELSELTHMELRGSDDYVKACRKLIERGVKTVVVTLGKQGAMLVTEDETYHVEGIRVRSVDTTGAGDAFNAALAFMLARGSSYEEAVKLANVAGALATTKVGAQEALPTFSEINNFLSSFRIQP